MTLHLTLKAQWYNMIESGEKKEEYREIKPYWMHRLMVCYRQGFRPCKYEKCAAPDTRLCLAVVKHFDNVTFHYGYSGRIMTYKIQEITTGTGKTEWGAEEGKQYFIIKLGERINEESK